MTTDGAPTGGVPSFVPIDRSVRLADRVVMALTEMIVEGEIEVGAKLPAERDLCEQFGVSRPVLREAVRSLIAKGLLEDNPGRGHIVRGAGRESLTESMTLYLRGQKLDYSSLQEVRSVIEVEAAGLAAERAVQSQLDDLEAALGMLQLGMTAAEGAEADLAFHRAIAVATNNDFFVVLIDSIRDVLIAAQLPTLAQPKIVRVAMKYHAEIAREILAGDADGARAAMRAHLQNAGEGLRSVLAENPARAQID